MGFLNNIFSGNPEPEKSNVDWIALTSMEQLDEITNVSSQEAVLIFKHSTRCGISRMVLKKLESTFNPNYKVTPYFLDLLAYRAISDAVSEKFNVVHQSPQLLVIKGGKSVYDVSHDAIDAVALAERI